MDEPTVAELAWAAGFWDGEGCISLATRSSNYGLHISQAGDEGVALLERFALSIGIEARIYGETERNRNPKYKPAFKLAAAQPSAYKAIGRCWPYLSETKRAQAQRAVDAYAAKKAAFVHFNLVKDVCPNGHPYDDENTFRETTIDGKVRRHCRTCQREHQQRVAERNGVRIRSGKYKVVPPYTHCIRGHPWDDENTYVGTTGTRFCKACKNERRRARRALARGIRLGEVA